jgi:hypothetical protein
VSRITKLLVMRLHVLLCGLVFTNCVVEAQFSRQAEAAIQGAVKIAVTPPPTGPQAGEPIDFGLHIQNGKSAAATLPIELRVEVQLLGSSGEVVQNQTCTIRARTADAQCSVPSPKAGLYKVKAVPSDRQLSEGSSYVLVRPGKSRKTPALNRKPQAKLNMPSFALALVAYRPDEQDLPVPAPKPTAAAGCGATTAPSHAKVILTINEGGEAGGAFRASVENAVIQAFFEAEDGGSAPSNVYIWLSPDHGSVDHQPLVIPKCTITGAAQLSSKYPVRTTVVYKVVPGSYQVDAPATLQATFVRPIIGIGTVPDGTQTLSLIDRVPLVAQFFDANGDAAPTDSERTVMFISNNSVISPKEQSITVKPGQYSAQTTIMPFWLGTGTIFVSAEHLKTASHQIAVIGWILIVVCLFGGSIGGLVSFLIAGGKAYSRLVVGIAAGIVLTWAYVFGLLPKVDATVAHNYISVFVVSILGGYLSIKTFDMVLKRFGWGAE